MRRAIVAVRRERDARCGSTPDRPTPFDVRYTLDGDVRFTDPGRLSGDHAAVGHADGHRHEQGGDRLAGAARRDAGLRPDNTGSENYGGPVVTAGGLVFIGATNYDNKFRAFDAAHAARCCGRRRCRPPATRRRLSTRSAASSSSSSPPAAASGAPRRGGSYVAFALP